MEPVIQQSQLVPVQNVLSKLHHSVKNLIGQKFGTLEVIDISDKRDKSGHIYWICKCECGNISHVSSNHLCSKKKPSQQCRKCAHLLNSAALFKGYKSISAKMWGIIIKNAKKRNIVVKIDIKYAANLLERQKHKCAISGKMLTGYILGANHSSNKKLYNASLDRKDSSKGYIKGNVQWVLKDVNIAKHAKSDKDFIQMCCEIADFQRGKECIIDKKTEISLNEQKIETSRQEYQRSSVDA